jgi:hypothetical protein
MSASATIAFIRRLDSSLADSLSGMVFENTKYPLKVWVHRSVPDASTKGMSALRIKRMVFHDVPLAGMNRQSAVEPDAYFDQRPAQLARRAGAVAAAPT